MSFRIVLLGRLPHLQTERPAPPPVLRLGRPIVLTERFVLRTDRIALDRSSHLRGKMQMTMTHRFDRLVVHFEIRFVTPLSCLLATYL